MSWAGWHYREDLDERVIDMAEVKGRGKWTASDAGYLGKYRAMERCVQGVICCTKNRTIFQATIK